MVKEALRLSTGKGIEVEEGKPGYVADANLDGTEKAEAETLASQWHAAQQPKLMARCAEERRIAKEKMLARNAARIADLQAKGELKAGETLEQYDDRKAVAKGAQPEPKEKLVKAEFDEKKGVKVEAVSASHAKGMFGGG